MSTATNFPEAAMPPTANKKSNNSKNIVIGLLSVAVVALGGYLAYSKSATSKTISQQETKITGLADEKSAIQSSFDASLARLDSMSTVNNGLNSQLTAKNDEITKAKNEIRDILNKKNASVAELAKAKTLIASLNDKIAGIEAEVARLTEENKGLNNDKVVLTQQKEQLNQDLVKTVAVKQELEQKVDIASTLNASNIQITPVNMKSNGKEKVSTTAKRVDKLVISFDVNNRIAPSGTTDVYVLVIGPDGKPIATTAETFTARTEGPMNYTAKVPVDVRQLKQRVLNLPLPLARLSNKAVTKYSFIRMDS
jgi:myosin heavy subunit